MENSTGWVSPFLSDGLGNRLFQVAAAMGAAEKYGLPLVFFLPRCNKASHTSPQLIWKLFPSVPIVEFANPTWKEIPEKDFSTYEALPDCEHKNIVVRGFRQSEKYFPSLPVTLDFLAALGSEEIKRLNGLFSHAHTHTPKTAFLHIRLGDYRILPHHAVNLEQYWIKTLGALTGQFDRLLLFSDEPEFVQHTMLPFFQQFGNAEVIDEKDPVACLYLMSLCTAGAVCANSTFSWWGAYFSVARKNGAPIFMPKSWGDFTVKDIHPAWATVIDT
jgi:hypothetical protein